MVRVLETMIRLKFLNLKGQKKMKLDIELISMCSTLKALSVAAVNIGIHNFKRKKERRKERKTKLTSFNM
jgi:hypothetical protein